MPTRAPEIDEVIDVIWVLRLVAIEDDIEIPVVWRWSRTDDWQYVGSEPPLLNDELWNQ